MSSNAYPSILATGGLEGVAGSVMAMDQSRFELDADAVYIDCAGCIDAPQSLPAGALYATRTPRQVYVTRA